MRYPTASKYKSQKCKCGFGHTHDSKKEARRCNELHIMEKAHEISGLRVQEKFELIPAQYEPTGELYVKGTKKGEAKMRCIEQACSYTADFVYFDERKKKIIIEDTKGYRTKEYIIKRKLMRFKYCIENTVFIET